DGFIKFALGENVKQSNWGEPTQRYPQTRMGVEQVFYDAFFRAKAYETSWKDFTDRLAKSKGIKPEPPRKDLESETLLEILHGKRFITCHSYVQSEINMLMHVADSMGFKVNTFTHILEGYKVADKMKAHGVNASSFSDWWAYKFEVYEAIPYNAAILTKVGVNTAINSDDAEMARRLNQEAAKSVKYGGMSEEDAWKMVTLNPAKMLHLDRQMGSLKAGKDADVVVWSDNPLSIYAKVEKTFVDGILYYDLERDALLDKRNTTEKLRLIKKMMEAKASGERTVKPTRKTNKQYHCDTIGEEMEEDHN
ncbi:MAG TPA: amidohydrolase family protein, partial [Flavobacteriales bacterium]|nr:amidohydrolase family protein [Flavobacteriales bacterium]